MQVLSLKQVGKMQQMWFVTFGFIFETLCIRDLKIYSSLYNGEISYYHDKYDLEADCVLHLDDEDMH